MKYNYFALFSFFLILLIASCSKKESSEINLKQTNLDLQNQVHPNTNEPQQKENRYFVSTDSLKVWKGIIKVQY